MITKWTLYNFKSIRDETELEFGPLTIFAGTNSSGKSTVIQSILLISQTLSSRVRSRSVVLNGHLAKLGQFDDLRTFKSDADQIFISWECEPHLVATDPLARRRVKQLKVVGCDISFDAGPVGAERDLTQLQPRLFSCGLHCISRGAESTDVVSSLIVGRAGQPDKIQNLAVRDLDEAMRPGLEYDTELDENSAEELAEDYASAEPVGCTFRHFLPNRLLVRFDQVEHEARQLTSAICDLRYYAPRRAEFLEKQVIPRGVIDLLKSQPEQPVQPLFDVLDVGPLFSEERYKITLPNWVMAIRRLPFSKQVSVRQAVQALQEEIHTTIVGGREAEYALTQLSLPDQLMDSVSYLEYFFSNSVEYLGPLRDEPKPLYPLAANVDPTDIGLRGENTAAVFDLHKGNFVRYIPTANLVGIDFSPQAILQAQATRTLESAVTDWLQYMGIAERIETVDRGKLGHELKVITADVGMPHDLTHVGVGVSQVLPILVMCLLAQPDTTIIIEQPELHLHPKVQTLLGDFFLSMAMLDKQCIVETHSEYIINRLRFRAAAAQADEVSSLLKVYFAEKKNGASEFRPVNVNQYGAILEWPEGFFDQSQSEAEEILRAATRKRKAGRKA